MHYLYSGDFVLDVENSVANLDKVIEILGVADAEFLDDVSLKSDSLTTFFKQVKMLCEQRLI